MSKKEINKLKRTRCIETIKEIGLIQEEFGTGHFRIEGEFDYWSSTGKYYSASAKLTGYCLPSELRAVLEQVWHKKVRMK